MVENFSNIHKAMQEIRAKTGHLPIRVKLNPQWMKQNIPQKLVPSDLKFTSVYGLPIELDSKVNTYEFVYAEGKY